MNNSVDPDVRENVYSSCVKWCDETYVSLWLATAESQIDRCILVFKWKKKKEKRSEMYVFWRVFCLSVNFIQKAFLCVLLYM